MCLDDIQKDREWELKHMIEQKGSECEETIKQKDREWELVIEQKGRETMDKEFQEAIEQNKSIQVYVSTHMYFLKMLQI